MPYTPPAGNAVNFNFFGSYLPPFGSFVPFLFGVVPPPPPPPPPGTSQLPTGMRQVQQHEDDWLWMPRRRFAPPTEGVAGPIGLRHRVIPWLQFQDPEWFPSPSRNIRFTPIIARLRKPVLFTVC